MPIGIVPDNQSRYRADVSWIQFVRAQEVLFGSSKIPLNPTSPFVLLNKFYGSLEARIEHARDAAEWIPEQLPRKNPLEAFEILTKLNQR